MKKLSRDFYDRDTLTVAREVLGTYLVRRLEGQTLVGQITEAEAYIGRIDRACHAYQYHKTPRNAMMFAPPGHAYIYFTYGMHHCLNLVTEPEGEPSAVLIRGIRPVYGQEAMSLLRWERPLADLTPYQRKNFGNGPGKVCKALSLTRAQNGLDLEGDELFLCASLPELNLPPAGALEITVGPRMGIVFALEGRVFPWRLSLSTPAVDI